MTPLSVIDTVIDSVNEYSSVVARSSTQGRRARGRIRRRGGSFQVLVYAGTDPLTGKANYLTESTRELVGRQILPAGGEPALGAVTRAKVSVQVLE